MSSSHIAFALLFSATTPENGAQETFLDSGGRPRASEELFGKPAAIIDRAVG